MRHRTHVVDAIARSTEAQEAVRTGTLLSHVKAGEGRAERLYRHAEEILTAALHDKDRRTALQAVRAAVDVMGEARSYMELRGELTGELGRDKTPPPMSIQIICPSNSGDPATMPRISYATAEAIEAIDDDVIEIGLFQRP